MNDRDELVANAVNEASAAAGNLVYEFATRFDARKDYLSVEKLAQEVQAAVVRSFSARITSPAKEK